MSVMFWVWLGVIVVTAIVEFATAELVSIWFTAGAIIPFILAGIDCVDWWVQVVIFVAISAILILSLRKVAKKFLTRGSGATTNADNMIGKEYIMQRRTDFENVGEVKVNGVVWSAIDVDRKTIEKDEKVRVLDISGNKLIVEKVQKENEKSVKDEESPQTDEGAKIAPKAKKSQKGKKEE